MTTSPGTSWEELIAITVVGSARGLRQVPVHEMAGISAETEVLNAAAVAQATRRAGLLARVDPESPWSHASPDSMNEPPEAAVSLLELILSQEPFDNPYMPEQLLTEWCLAAQQAGCHIPHHLLPAMLKLVAKASTRLALAIRTVLDERGRWLAGAIPAYRHSAGDIRVDRPLPDPVTWSAIPIHIRAALVDLLRTSEPSKGLALVESTWAHEASGNKTELLKSLRTGLSMADEPFLESVLDDSSAAVRASAGDLLDGLPESRRAARMATRLVDRLSVDDGAIQVALPDKPDKDLLRDGLLRDQRLFWVSWFISGAPLEVWDRLGGTGVIRQGVGVNRPVWWGLTRATIRQRNVEWARAFLPTPHDPDEIHEHFDAEMLSLLPPQEAQAWVRQYVAARPEALDPGQFNDRLVKVLPHPWSSEVSVAMAAWLAHWDATSESTIAWVARSLDPVGLAALAEHAQQQQANQWSPMMQALYYLPVRQSIQEAFSADGSPRNEDSHLETERGRVHLNHPREWE